MVAASNGGAQPIASNQGPTNKETNSNKGIYQLGLGHEILVDVDRHVNNALQGHLMYFLPFGGGLIG